MASVLMVMSPLLLRRWLTRYGALALSILLLISPSILYFGRFARNDGFIILFTIGMVFSIFAYQETKKPRYLYALATLLALSFAAKENTFLTVAIFGAFLVCASGRELLNWVTSFGHMPLSPKGIATITIGTFVLPQLSAAFSLLPFLRIPVDALPIRPDTTGTAWPSGLAVMALFLIISVVIGLRLNPRLWLTAAACFYVPFVALYTSFGTNPNGLATGIWGSLAYWIEQQDVARGSQPWYYYWLLLGIYEFLPVIVTLIYGGVRTAKQYWWRMAVAGWFVLSLLLAAATNISATLNWTMLFFGPIMLALLFEVAWKQEGKLSFDRFVAFWAIGSLVLYTFAGEKMPWLVVHIVLPILVLAAQGLQRLVGSLPSWRKREIPWAAVGVGTVALVITLPSALASAAEGRIVDTFLRFLALALIWYVCLRFVRGLGWGEIARVGVVGLVAIAGALTLRSAVVASFQNGDTPVEMLVYTQSSPDITRLAGDIERMASYNGGRDNLVIVVDGTDGYHWPWSWYLRDYDQTQYPTLATGATGDLSRAHVLLIHRKNVPRVDPLVLDNFGPGIPFKHRWWFPENEVYRDWTLQRIGEFLGNGKNWARLWNYFMYRELDIALGSTDAVAYFSKNAPWASLPGTVETTPAEAVARPGKSLSADLKVTAEGLATLNEAVAGAQSIALAPDGTIVVADTMRHRLLRLDTDGQTVAQVGSQGEEDGSYNEPWGVAVASDGTVYVADTWNHRIVKLDDTLRFVKKWGSFGQGDASTLYGPRALVVDADGFVYVADTGNKRIVKYNGDGQMVAVVGGAGAAPGEFSEPVGLALDAQGFLYVADTWNRRIQKLDRNLNPVAQFAVPGWVGQSPINKPYIAVDKAGNVLVSDPEARRLIMFNPAGEVIAYADAIDHTSLQRPSGVAASDDGFYVIDAATGKLHLIRMPVSCVVSVATPASGESTPVASPITTAPAPHSTTASSEE